MLGRIAVVVIAVGTVSCASSGQVKALEDQLAELQKAERQRDVQTRETLTHIEGELAQLQLTSHGSDDELSRKTDELGRKIDVLEAQLKSHPLSPPAKPRSDPSPADVYAIPVAGDPSKGPADALVTIVRAGEYACPFCAKLHDTLDQISLAYPQDVRIVYKSFVVHPRATDAAAAACAAQRQHKYWALDALLWEKAFKTSQYEKDHLEELAQEAGLDLKRFRADVAGSCPSEMVAEQAALSKFGMNGTPTTWVNGRIVIGAQPIEQFRTLIDEELAKAKDRVKQGTRRKDYYETWVIKKGLTEFVPPKS